MVAVAALAKKRFLQKNAKTIVMAVLAVMLGLVLLGIMLVTGYRANSVLEGARNASCGAPSGAQTDAEVGDLSEEQLNNAATIISVGNNYGLDRRDAQLAQIIAVATAMQESTLNNIDYGDRDSLGLFQQRPSQGWGTPAQVTDPVYASTQFYDRLLEIDGWQNLPVTVAAQQVQRSAFPDAYAKWEGLATEIVVRVAGTLEAIPGTAGPVACLPGGPTVGLDPTLEPQNDNPGVAVRGIPVDGLRQRAYYAKMQVLQRWGCEFTDRDPCVTSIGGKRDDPGSDHHTGRAIDVMIGSGCVSAGSVANNLGDEIDAWAEANYGTLGVSYVIWEDFIWSPDKRDAGQRPQNKLRPGEGAGNCTFAHQDHVHISFTAG